MFFSSFTVFIAACLPAVLAQTGTGTASGSGAQPTGGNFTAQYKLYGWHDCKGNDERDILDGLKEANTILGANGNYYIDSWWDSMNAVEYFGAPSDVKFNNRQKGLAANLRNAYSYTNGWWFSANDAEVFCHDGSMSGAYAQACTSSQYPDPIVVVPNYGGNGKTAYMFCDSWFDLSTLPAAVSSGKAAGSQDSYDLSNYENRGRAWITALMLNPKVGRNPQNKAGKPLMAYQRYNFPGFGSHYATTAAQCKMMAKARTDIFIRPLINPDSISWYALASYVQDSNQLGEYPIMPYVPKQLSFPAVAVSKREDEARGVDPELEARVMHPEHPRYELDMRSIQAEALYG